MRLNRIGPEWLDLHDVSLAAGRSLRGADATPGATAALVNHHFVRDVLGNKKAVGRRFRYVGLSGDADLESVDLGQRYEIVGESATFCPVSNRA